MNHETHPGAGEPKGKEPGKSGIKSRLERGADALKKDYKIITERTEARTPKAAETTESREPKNPLKPTEQRRYGEEFTKLQQAVDQKMIAATEDSQHNAAFAGEEVNPYVSNADITGDHAGFRQGAQFRVQASNPVPFPLEEDSDSRGSGFRVDIIRGREPNAPIQIITIDSIAMQNGSSGFEASRRLLLVDYRDGNMEYVNSKKDIALKRGDGRMKEVLDFWADQMDSATVLPPKVREPEPQRKPRLRSVFKHK